MNKLNYWDIERKDTRNRCGDCLRIFTFSEQKHRCHRLEKGLYRFTKICSSCKEIQAQLN